MSHQALGTCGTEPDNRGHARRAGPRKVIDGDTIAVAGNWSGCTDDLVARSAGGTMLSAALEVLTAGVNVRCEVVERDRHGRIVAKVFAPNGVDISRSLVMAGWALAYRRYSTDYIEAEKEAREAKRGMWRGSFMKPWVWRASQEPQAPARVVPMSGPRR